MQTSVDVKMLRFQELQHVDVVIQNLVLRVVHLHVLQQNLASELDGNHASQRTMFISICSRLII